MQGRPVKALQIDRYGGPEVIVHRDIELPTPGDGEVQIRLSRAGINFMDIHTREGKYAGSRTYPLSLPLTLGMEGAGYITSIGSGVSGFSIGERVAYCIVWGSYAEYAVVPAWRVVKVPDALSLDVAAASLFHGCTAHYLVTDVAKLAPGMSCLVHAASGGIGQMLIQMAKRLGAVVLTRTSTADKAQVARSRGADSALMYDNGRFADAVRDLTDGRGVDVVFDSIGQATLRDSFRATRVRGLVVNYGTVSGSVRDLDPIELGEAGSLFLTRPRLADHISDGASLRRRAADIFAALLDGSLRMDIAGHFDLTNVHQAHAALAGRRITGKPLLDIAD